MTDDADRSDAKIEAFIENAIAKSRRGTSMVFTGECYFCGTELTMPQRFCDVFCRDDYEAEQKAKRLRGG